MQSDEVGTKEWRPLDKFQVEHEGETESLYVDLASKQTHCFRVKAKNAEGWSDYSKAVSFEMTHSYISHIILCTHFHAAIMLIMAYIYTIFVF